MIRLEALKYLEEVANTESIGKAADNLFMSKSTLSSAIKILEDEIGVPLLERSVQGVKLTPAGKMVIEKAGLIFEIISQINAESWLYKGIDGIEGIHYYVTNSFAENLFPGLLQHVHQILGDVCLNIHTSKDGEEVMQHVAENTLNVGFILNNRDNMDTHAKKHHIVADCIGKYTLYAVFAKHSKFLKDDVTEISEETFLDLPRVWMNYQHDATSKKKRQSVLTEPKKKVLVTSSNSLYYQAIKNDIGVGMLPLIGSQYSLAKRDDLRYITIKDSNADSYYLHLLTHEDCLPELREKHINSLIKYSSQ